MFDEITLLSEGMLIYSGAAADMDAYFASIGYTYHMLLQPSPVIRTPPTYLQVPTTGKEPSVRVLRGPGLSGLLHGRGGADMQEPHQGAECCIQEE